MKVLILSCNTGSGHNACAAAVQEALVARGVACNIRDGLAFVSRPVSRLISAAHVRLYRSMPRLYGRGYSLAERRSAAGGDGGDSLSFRFFSLGARPLRACIASEGYTHVVSTHLFPAMMLTAMQRRDPLPIHTAFISTDYTASPGYEAIAVDRCIAPAPELIPDFTKPGVPASHVLGCGIPVSRAFQTAMDKSAARRALGLDADCRHILIMSGSMGCGPLERVLARLNERLGTGIEISIICGTNRGLHRRLLRRYGAQKNCHIHDFVDQISLYMDSADLYLTKPGGLSVSEALSKKLPMLFLQAVEGCETYNMRYCLNRGAAVTADGADAVADLCARLICDDAALKKMRDSMAGLFEVPAAEVVCDCLFSMGE
ncbi:MAG: polysaccharide biosynthesis protein [Clostridia bacterium]|nr:polysaccharide biosynthesis protein [Clostridia bacterium]